MTRHQQVTAINSRYNRVRSFQIAKEWFNDRKEVGDQRQLVSRHIRSVDF